MGKRSFSFYFKAKEKCCSVSHRDEAEWSGVAESPHGDSEKRNMEPAKLMSP